MPAIAGLDTFNEIIQVDVAPHPLVREHRHRG